jgi:hypothetical protein
MLANLQGFATFRLSPRATLTTNLNMKTYIIEENNQKYTVQATSMEKALCQHFGVDRVCKTMGRTNQYGNMRYSKTRSEIYRSATIERAQTD